ncbi:hypothetical protein HANVADRAFT_47166 [Hanseniaspora valbyensis NRRL Y-1626]|uniref:Uncharacterized protein n=1 Tax=Hanseniaspora valbyensis NRRL Y-1626 TaxID=766949 RepID=A0A1B7TIL8_9ASCO|nr:hypothetical protein HANVADRAFT_50186 [Hanseniaspora valbyensis NRRL Y-1626]OBA28485.1 hypothetical protein HANVADRAFT_47166 [Hanseniaspora valbyensis NRRL Y-1626]
MSDTVDLFQVYGISKSGLHSGISYDIESTENSNPWDQINYNINTKPISDLKENKENEPTNILLKDYSNFDIFANTRLDFSKENVDTSISSIESEKERQLLNPFNNDSPITLSQPHYELITSKITSFNENVKKGCYDITSISFDTSEFLTLYSLLNNHSLNLSHLLKDVKIHEQKLQSSIQSNFNDILILKSNLDSVLQNYDSFLKGDTHYNKNYENLKHSFNELMRMANESHNEINSINEFIGNFDKVKGNKTVMNLLCLPNVVLSLFQLNRIDEMIDILVLYDNYKLQFKKNKSKFSIFFKRIDDEIYEVLKNYRQKVLNEIREDLKVANFEYQDLLNVNNYDEEASDIENNENIFKIFERLLVINHNYNAISSLYTEHISKEEDTEEEENVKNIIDYWITLQLAQFEQSLTVIDKTCTSFVQIESKGINNRIVKNNSSIIRYLRNYLTLLTMNSNDGFYNEVEEEEDDEEEDEDEYSNVEKILAIFNNVTINSKKSNDFWKKWNKLYEMLLPLVNNLSNFNKILTNLKNVHNSKLYSRFILEQEDFKKMDLVDELFDNNDHLIPKEYYTIETFFKNKLNDGKKSPITTENRYDQVYLSDNGGTLTEDLQIIENSIKEKVNEFIQNNIIKRFFNNDGSDNELNIDSNSYYLHWVRPLSILNNDLRLFYTKLNKKEDVTQLSTQLVAVLNDMLLKDINNLVLLEDWKTMNQNSNLTISCLLFEKILIMHTKLVDEITNTLYPNVVIKLVYDCCQILMHDYLKSDKQLIVLNNLDHLKNITIPKLAKISHSNPFVAVTKEIETSKDKTINNYILKDCRNLYKIINQATPYKTADFSNYWSTFTVDNSNTFKISNNIVGSLINLKIIESNINMKFKSVQLINRVKERYLEIVVEYFSKILDLSGSINLSIDCFLQMGIDYFYILQEIQVPFDIDVLKNSSNNNSKKNIVYTFVFKLIHVAFNDDLEQFENYFDEIYNILQTSI